ncbi:cytochrome P450 [Gemmata sp. G18]|uniref:Cytochrome P450 n=1 Tax=Gemmata palustris TaxID=2822762 RepID=A0ABS5C4N7_9BACT|nr:cytochrome P450 [Gemmata palustris]MBP3960953.1 cytochrome P450 [Gemmata palustris]
MSLPLFNPFDPRYVADPHTYYARLRQTAPVQRAVLPDGQAVWLLTRYADVEAVFTDPRMVKDPRSACSPEQLARMPIRPESTRYARTNMLSRDPPDHTRLRRLVSKAFTPRMVEQLRPRVQAIADALLDAVADRGEMDVIDEYAFPLPITVIAEMLGIPAADRDQFREWSDAILTAIPPQPATPEAVAALEGLARYLGDRFEDRRRAPAEDLITGLVQAEEAGDKLSKDELQGMAYVLLVAGYETTANLIGSGVLALLEHPDQLARLRADPALMPSAVEELLRFTSPVKTSTVRYAAADVSVADVVIPKGEMVLVIITAANRDPARFPSPDTLDITRPDNKHLAFGHGIHYCLGAPLARLEGEIAFGTLLRRLPDLRLGVAGETLTWRPSFGLRGLAKLPVRF